MSRTRGPGIQQTAVLGRELLELFPSAHDAANVLISALTIESNDSARSGITKTVPKLISAASENPTSPVVIEHDIGKGSASSYSSTLQKAFTSYLKNDPQNRRI